jgi:phosphoribosyl 1,2-cyclic phosphodiesterase
MDFANRLVLRFWGVRGSTPTPSQENLGFGGNTSCIEVRSNNNVVVLDLGTGARKLGESLLAEHQGRPMTLHIFLTHYHWDHLQGLPLFMPLYNPANNITFHASGTLGSIKERLRGQMTAPYFPVEFSHVPSQVQFVEIEEQAVEVGELRIRPFAMHHPQGAFGYRIESPYGTIVYASDVEHGHAELDSTLREFASGADVLVYDSQYTPDEYTNHKGWGHSNWLEATTVAREAGVKKLVLFHHDPSHDDTTMERIEGEARLLFPNTVAAREGQMLEVPDGNR